MNRLTRGIFGEKKIKLISEAEVEERTAEAVNIIKGDPWEKYKKSSKILPPHRKTHQRRHLVHDKDDDSLWIVSEIGDSKEALCFQFGALALCRGHENFIKYRETFLSDGSYFSVTEVPERCSVSLSSLIKKFNKAPPLAPPSQSQSLDQIETESNRNSDGKSKSSSRNSREKETGNEIRFPIPEETALFILQQILRALAFMHEKCIVHRDLIPENILVDICGGVKICDTLLSEFLTIEHPVATEVKGKVQFLSPEAMRGWDQTQISDIWSFGILTLKVAENRVPFSRLQDPETIMKAVVTNRAPQLSRSGAWSKNFIKMNELCLQHNIHKRESASKLLKHKCWKKASSKEEFRSSIGEFFQAGDRDEQVQFDFNGLVEDSGVN